MSFADNAFCLMDDFVAISHMDILLEVIQVSHLPLDLFQQSLKYLWAAALISDVLQFFKTGDSLSTSHTELQWEYI